ncbi:hypothetical protein VTH82DRAFT_7839 [Thermothelomyces myriococcoides]
MATSTTFTSALKGDRSLADSPTPPSDVIPNSANLFPKWGDKLSPTGLDIWIFDAISENGGDTLGISFFRDGSEASKGFKVTVNATWVDGTVWGRHLFAPVSEVTLEGADISSGLVRGVWRTEDNVDGGGDGERVSATFEVAADLSTARVTIDAPGRVTGTLTLRSRGYPALPKTAREAELALGVHWTWAIALADTTADLTFHFDDPARPGEKTARRLILGPEQRAFGGLDRSWTTTSWVKEATESVYLRAKAGPYYVSLMRLVGTSRKNYEAVTTGALFGSDGKLLSRVLAPLPPDQSDSSAVADTVEVEKLYDGDGLSAKFRDKAVGTRLVFHSARAEEKGAKWTFDLRNRRAWWARPTSPPGPNATGSYAFVVEVTGGRDGSDESLTGWGYIGYIEVPNR